MARKCRICGGVVGAGEIPAISLKTVCPTCRVKNDAQASPIATGCADTFLFVALFVLVAAVLFVVAALLENPNASGGARNNVAGFSALSSSLGSLIGVLVWSVLVWRTVAATRRRRRARSIPPIPAPGGACTSIQDEVENQPPQAKGCVTFALVVLISLLFIWCAYFLMQL